MIQVNRIYLIFNRLVTKKFFVDTSDISYVVLWVCPSGSTPLYTRTGRLVFYTETFTTVVADAL